MQTRIENIPEELKKVPQWVCWQGQAKIPKNPFNGQNAKSNDPTQSISAQKGTGTITVLANYQWTAVITEGAAWSRSRCPGS